MTELLEKQTSVPACEDDMQLFLCQIREFPRLTVEEERELARRCAQGDEDAIRHMVTSNLRLVVSIAKEYAGRGVALLDLIQEGSIGLLVAARKFDYTLEYRFSTYATKWIRQGVTRCLLNHAGLIRVPLHTAERMRKVEIIRRELRQENGEEPTTAQIAEKSGIPEAKVLELIRLMPEVFSLDIPTGQGEESSLHTLLEDVQAPQPYEELVRRELEQTIRALLSTLNDRQQQILRLHFGMADGICHSLEDIGKRMGISKERVRQIKQQAMEKLQENGESLGLEDFIND